VKDRRFNLAGSVGPGILIRSYISDLARPGVEEGAALKEGS
jgi:hypothetical protein